MELKEQQCILFPQDKRKISETDLETVENSTKKKIFSRQKYFIKIKKTIQIIFYQNVYHGTKLYWKQCSFYGDNEKMKTVLFL